jgi:O-antigen ligase
VSETRAVVVQKRAARASLPRFLPSWLQARLTDGTRLAVAAGALVLLLISGGIVSARALGNDFPTAVFVVAAVVAAVGLVHPFIAVLGAILVSPTFAWATFGPDVSPFQVLVAGAALGCLRELWPRARLRRFVVRPEVLLALLFVAWLIVAAGVRRDTTDWAFIRNYLGALVFFAACIVTLRTARRRRYAVGALVIGCTATAVVGLAQLISTEALVSGWVLPNVSVIQESYDRLGSPWGLGNVGSEYGKDVLVGFLLTLPLLLGRLRWEARLLLIAVTVILGAGLAMSGSRSAWLAGSIAVLYVAIVWRRPVGLLLAALAAALAVLVLRPETPVDIQVALGLPSQASRPVERESPKQPRPPSSSAPMPQRLVIAGSRDPASTEASNDLRRRLTTAGLEMVRDEPLFGVGAGSFKRYVDQYEPIRVTDQPIDARERLPAHNVYLEIWSGSGTPALVLYAAFLGAVLLGLRRVRLNEGEQPLSLGLTAAFLGVAVAGAFHNYQYDNLLWALSGVGISMALWRTQESTGVHSSGERADTA